MDGGPRQRIGIVGFGALGRFLAERIVAEGDAHGCEIAFVWNRTAAAVAEHPLFAAGGALEGKILPELDAMEAWKPTLVVEVAHPALMKTLAPKVLAHADYFCGSPTALADAETETVVRAALAKHGQRVYVPCGALWGAVDIARMRRRGTLRRVHVTMAKHPTAFRLQGEMEAKAKDALERGARVTLYDGPARALCPQAPNNVNTIACAALAGVGFDDTQATVIADASLESHDIDVVCEGPVNEATGRPFSVTARRINPAKPGAVTGSATFNSFYSSLLDCVECVRRGGDFHFV